MPLSGNLNTYADIRQVLDQAIAQGGARYRLSSPGAAVRWRQRAYQFRKLLFKQAEDAQLLPGQIPSTPYDMMYITLEGNDAVIQLRQPDGALLSLDGGEQIPFVQDHDELEREAEEFARKLRGMD